VALLLPCLTLAHLVGLWVADAGWLSACSARWLGVACVAFALPLRRLPRALASLLVLGFFASGVAALGGVLETARRHPVETAFDAIVEADVCELERRRSSLRLVLCHAVGVGRHAERVPERIVVHQRWSMLEPSWARALEPGQRLRCLLRIRPLGGLRNPGVTERIPRWQRRGIGARASLVDERRAVRVLRSEKRGLVSSVAVRLGASFDRRRAAIRDRLLASGRSGALLASLSIGDRSGLPNETRDAFARLGLAHLLAVSGLHLSMLAGLAFWSARRAWLRCDPLARRVDARPVAMLFALSAAGVYAAMCGFALPVRRAWIFLFAIWLGLHAARRPSALHLLSLAALAVAAWEPDALFSAGAQLSFGVSAALMLARLDSDARPTSSRFMRTLRLLVGSTSVAVATSAPLLAMHGMESGVAGLLSNLVAIPWTAAVLLPAALGTGAACALEGELACRGALLLGGFLAQLTLECVDWLAAGLPDAGFTAPPAPWALALGGAMVIGVVRTSAPTARVGLALMLCLGLRWAPAAAIEPSAPRLVVLDVGQGDALLVQGREAGILIDGGTALPGGFDAGRSVVGPALAALGVERLDLVIATHADLDHRGGLLAVLESIPVRELWIPLGASSDPALRDLLRLSHRRGVRVLERGRGDGRHDFGDLSVTPLWPGPPADGGNRNDRSLVVRVDHSTRRLLLTGDIGFAAERQLLATAGPELRADVLKVGHHGSAGSTSQAFLDAVSPELAVISAACASRMSLPSATVLSRLERSVPRVLWTGRDGAAVIGLRGAAGSPPPASASGAPRRCEAR
jgi:competence protein ComEC